MRRGACLASAMAFLFLGREALAAEDPDVPDICAGWGDEFLVLAAQAGLGAPTGLGGLALEMAPSCYFALGLGVGASPWGAQMAWWLKVRVPVRPTLAWGLKTGPSTGPFEMHKSVCIPPFASCDDPPSNLVHTWSQALWSNTSLALEGRMGALRWSAEVGVAVLLNPSSAVSRYQGFNDKAADDTSIDAPNGVVLPFVGTSWGVAF